MPECELCGKKGNLVKARIDGILLNVCRECARSGQIIEETKPVKIKIAHQKLVEPEEIVVPDYAEKIRLARQRAGLKQEDVAKSLNEKLSVISAVESGKRTPDLKLAKKFEKFFKINLIEIE